MNSLEILSVVGLLVAAILVAVRLLRRRPLPVGSEMTRFEELEHISEQSPIAIKRLADTTYPTWELQFPDGNLHFILKNSLFQILLPSRFIRVEKRAEDGIVQMVVELHNGAHYRYVEGVDLQSEFVEPIRAIFSRIEPIVAPHIV